MKKSPFVKIDKRFATTFKNIRREYSEIEAAFSYSLDVNCGKPRSLQAYHRMWGWSVGRVKRFINDPDRGGTVTEQQRNSNGTANRLKSQQSHDTTEQQRNRDGTDTEHEYKEQRTKKKKNIKEYSDRFEEFWSLYPRKISKKKTYESWIKADCENGKIEDVMKGVKGYANHCSSENTEQKFIAHPTTWLNQERWTDEYDAVSKPVQRDYFKELSQ